MKKRGRPKSDSVNSKAIRLDLRIAENEKRAFKDAASVAGLPLSSWIRERLRIAAIRDLEAVGRIAYFLQ